MVSEPLAVPDLLSNILCIVRPDHTEQFTGYCKASFLLKMWLDKRKATVYKKTMHWYVLWPTVYDAYRKKQIFHAKNILFRKIPLYLIFGG